MLREALCLVALGFAYACTSSDPPSSSEEDEPTPPSCDNVVPGPAPLRLLTREQYNNTVRDLLGEESRPADAFPREASVQGFENNAELHLANPLLVSSYQDAAEELATAAMTRGLDRYLPCATDTADPSGCGQAFIAEFGRHAFRRPLEPAELDAFSRLFESSRQQYDFPTAIRLVMQAALQSPQFLYRAEAAAPTADTGAIPVGSWEMASRLSYFLWNSMPDAELFDTAARDELATPEQVVAQARRMLEDDRARGVIIDFHRQWLGLDRFHGIARDTPPDLYALRPVLSPAWRASIEAFLDHVFWQEGGTVETLFLSSTVFIDATLAPVYGVAPPAAGGFEARTFDSAERAGLLTQPGLMALLAHPDQSTPVRRGLFIREQLLCDPLPPPPPNVDTTPPDPDPNLTTRERFAVHSSSSDCAICHDRMEPIGFALEKYDQLGRFRADEHGLAIDTSGQVIGSEDPVFSDPFDGAPDLAARLASSSQVRDCLATQWYRYAMGRIEEAPDLCSVEQAKQSFADSGGDLRELLISLTQTDAFLYRQPASAEGAP